MVFNSNVSYGGHRGFLCLWINLDRCHKWMAFRLYANVYDLLSLCFTWIFYCTVYFLLFIHLLVIQNYRCIPPLLFFYFYRFYRFNFLSHVLLLFWKHYLIFFFLINYSRLLPHFLAYPTVNFLIFNYQIDGRFLLPPYFKSYQRYVIMFEIAEYGYSLFIYFSYFYI